MMYIEGLVNDCESACIGIQREGKPNLIFMQEAESSKNFYECTQLMHLCASCFYTLIDFPLVMILVCSQVRPTVTTESVENVPWH